MEPNHLQLLAASVTVLACVSLTHPELLSLGDWQSIKSRLKMVITEPKNHLQLLAALVTVVIWLYFSHPDLFHFREKHSTKSTFQKQYGKWGVIVGGTKGLGAEWSVQLAKRGLNLILIARKEDELKQIANYLEETFNIQTKIVALDVGKVDEWKSISESLANDYEVGFLIYNAALLVVGRHTDHDLSIHLNMVDVNVKGVLIALNSFLPKMRERKRGGIILMSSVVGQTPAAIHSTYGATKGFNRCISETLWAELREDNVDVLGVVPGIVSTPTVENLVDPEKRIRFIETSPKMVVDQSLRSLGRVPIAIVGSIPKKMYSFIQLILPPRIRAKIGMLDEYLYKPREQLVKIALKNKTDYEEEKEKEKET